MGDESCSRVAVDHEEDALSRTTRNAESACQAVFKRCPNVSAGRSPGAIWMKLRTGWNPESTSTSDVVILKLGLGKYMSASL